MFERFLLAIDETSAGDVGVSFACALARQHEASVHVVHGNLYLVGGRGVTVETREEATRLLDAAVAQLEAAGVATTGEVFHASVFSVAPRIADAAEGFGADAILLGSHRHRRMTRIFGRGIRERVIRATALPVLTAPSPLKLGRGNRRGPSGEIRRLARISTATDVAH
jgi:nucleotide-binding universal stress UspA family protein